MHGLRRRLSEPRMAGHRPADRSANQCVTSAGDSFLCIRMCGIKHTYINQKNQGENRACGKLEKCRIYRAILGFATETSLPSALSKDDLGKLRVVLLGFRFCRSCRPRSFRDCDGGTPKPEFSGTACI